MSKVNQVATLMTTCRAMDEPKTHLFPPLVKKAAAIFKVKRFCLRIAFFLRRRFNSASGSSLTSVGSRLPGYRLTRRVSVESPFSRSPVFLSSSCRWSGQNELLRAETPVSVCFRGALNNSCPFSCCSAFLGLLRKCRAALRAHQAQRKL